MLAYILARQDLTADDLIVTGKTILPASQAARRACLQEGIQVSGEPAAWSDEGISDWLRTEGHFRENLF